MNRRPIPTAAAMEAIGREIAAGLEAGAVIALCGELGTGKTSLTRGLVAGLGSPAVVTSPTFTLVHEYRGGRLLVAHFDFYRIGTAVELVAAGWDDFLESGGVVVVEWADRFPELLPPAAQWWELRHHGTGRLVSGPLTRPGTTAP